MHIDRYVSFGSGSTRGIRSKWRPCLGRTGIPAPGLAARWVLSEQVNLDTCARVLARDDVRHFVQILLCGARAY